MTRYLILLGLALLAFSLYMWRYKPKEISPTRRAIRRIFYSIWLIAMGFFFWVVPPGRIAIYGQNVFKLQPPLWVAFMLFIAGIAVDVLVISAHNIKSFAMGPARAELEDDATERVEESYGLYQDLASKVDSYYAVVKYLRTTPLEIHEGDFDLVPEFNTRIDEYLKKQDNQDQTIKVNDLDDTVTKCDLTQLEGSELSHNIEQDELTELKRNNKYITIMPYWCYSKEGQLVLVTIISEKPIIKSEMYLIKLMLVEIEDRVVDFYLQD